MEMIILNVSLLDVPNLIEIGGQGLLGVGFDVECLMHILKQISAELFDILKTKLIFPLRFDFRFIHDNFGLSLCVKVIKIILFFFVLLLLDPLVTKIFHGVRII